MIYQGSQRTIYTNGELVEITTVMSNREITKLLKKCEGKDIAFSVYMDEWMPVYAKLFGKYLKCVVFTLDSYDFSMLNYFDYLDLPTKYQYAFSFKDSKWFNALVLNYFIQRPSWGVVMNLTSMDDSPWFGEMTGKFEVLYSTNWFYMKMWGLHWENYGDYGTKYYQAIGKCLKNYYIDSWKNHNNISFLYSGTNEQLPLLHNSVTTTSFRLPAANKGAITNKQQVYKSFRDNEHKMLNNVKNQIDEADNFGYMKGQWSDVTRYFTSFFDIKYKLQNDYGAYHASNGWVKCWELLNYYQDYDFVKLGSEEEPFTYFDNASFPGSFILGTQHYYQTMGGKHFNWFASSKLDDDEIKPLHDDYELYKLNPDKWLMNQQFRGDVTNLKMLSRFKQKLGGKVDLYTSDLGFGIDDYNKQEEIQAHANLGQIVSGLLVLKIGGNMITKQYTYYHPFTVSMMAMMTLLFKKVDICKPMSSKPDNSETYLVGIGFLGLSNEIEKILFDKLTNWNLEPLPFTYSDKFYHAIKLSQSYFTMQQADKIVAEVDKFKSVSVQLKGVSNRKNIRKVASQQFADKRRQDVTKWLHVNKPRRMNKTNIKMISKKEQGVYHSQGGRGGRGGRSVYSGRGGRSVYSGRGGRGGRSVYSGRGGRSVYSGKGPSAYRW
jgi:hypothetical protein